MNATALCIFRRCSVAVAAGMVFFCNSAVAQDPVSFGDGTVTQIEATYMPGEIVFWLSSGNTLCPAGAMLLYSNSNADNMKAVYATLLANMLSGRRVYIYYHSSTVSTGGASPPASCRVHHVGTR